ncbi:MAG: VPS10 domain-containing protein [Ignavibacteriaceae bacterium]
MKLANIFAFVFILMLSFSVNAQTDKSAKEKDPLNASTFSGLKLRGIGPALTSGRISDFAVNPNDPAEYYVATASGGVWKTVNDGTTWQPIFDSEGSFSIGCITMDPNNPHVIWVGTGENNSQRSVSYGDGIYRSDDDGKTWKNMGLKSSQHIGKIIVDPKNSNVVYVAAQGPLWASGGDRGLYKTTDAGKTWKAVLTISENTGVSDLVMDPRDNNVLYAAAYQRRRHVFTLIDGGPESAIYKSTDAGETWNKLTNGIPKVDLGRIGLAISPVNPDLLFAIIEAEGDNGGVFRSTDRGASWEKRSSYMTTSPQYYNEIYCDPKDVDRVYAMDTHLHVTDDGGKTFKPLGEKNKHVDNHAIWINPNNTNYYLAGCDGGIYESYDRGVNWLFKSNLPVTQFYNVTVDNTKPFYFVYGGTQDNNSLGGPSQTNSASGIVNSNWFVTTGGDGFFSKVDPEDPNIVYAESQYGVLVRYDKTNGEQLGIQPQPGIGEAPFRWNWDSPLIISHFSHTKLYFAANKLFKSTDRGDSWKEISGDLTRQIDRDKLKVMGKVWSVDAVEKNASTSFYGNIVSLTESPLKEGMIYTGSDDGQISVTQDDGKSWDKYTKFPGVPETTYVSCLRASQFDQNTVYASFDNHQRNDFTPYLLKSDDEGKSWKSIAGNLPKNGYVHTIVEDYKNPNLLFAGTEFGLFFTIDGGKKWVQLKGNLPTIAVMDLAIQKRESDLALATFGRGFYILDNYSPLRDLTSDSLEKESLLFPVKNPWMFIPSQPLGDTGKASQGAAYYTADNPPFGATFTYYLKESIKTKKEIRQEEDKKLIKEDKPVPFPTHEELRAEDNEPKPYLLFTVYDDAGNVVRKLKAAATAGINRITWDLRYPSTNPVKSPEKDFSNSSSGMLVPPGMYKVTLSKCVDGVIAELAGPQTFITEVLNNSSLPAKDRNELAAFQKKVAGLNRAVMGAVNVADNLSNKIKLIKTALLNTPVASADMMKQTDSLEVQTAGIIRQLTGDKSLINRNINVPPSIVDRVQGIIGDEWQSTSAPTQTDINSYKATGELFSPLLSKLKTMVDVDLKNLENQMEAAGAPWTPGRIPDWKK